MTEDASPGAFMTDLSGRITWHERGLSNQEVGRQAHRFVLGELVGEALDNQWTVELAAGRPFGLGCDRWRLAMHPVRQADGTLTGWSGVARPASDAERVVPDLTRRMLWEADPLAVLEYALETLGRHLGATRVNYGEVDEDLRQIVVERDWTDGTHSVVGVWPTEAVGASILAEHATGATFVTEDLWLDPRFDAVDRQPYADAHNVAILTVPLVKDGRLEALLSIQQNRPRQWTPEEIKLAEEVADRTWSALQRARAVIARRESETLLSAIMLHAPIGIYLKDAQGRYVAANREMGRLFGRPIEDILGRTAADLLGEDYAQSIDAYDQQTLSSGRMSAIEEYLPGATQYEWSLVMRFPVQLAPDVPAQIAGFDIDITAQKRAEIELERSRQALFQSMKLTALGSLLAGVSHELNNPLSVVIGQAQMLQERTEGTPLAERALKIRNAAERCSRIVQTFLAMARQQHPERRACDLNALVETALDLTEYGLWQAGVDVERSLSPELPPAFADHDQMQQVLVNLIVNAQQALAERAGPRRLRVLTEAREDGVRLVVSDNGPGVPPQVRCQIFDPFFTTKPKGAGTGVGLSFSLGVVEAHGGSLVLLDGEDEGAAFELVLPLPPSEAAE